MMCTDADVRGARLGLITSMRDTEIKTQENTPLISHSLATFAPLSIVAWQRITSCSDNGCCGSAIVPDSCGDTTPHDEWLLFDSAVTTLEDLTITSMRHAYIDRFWEHRKEYRLSAGAESFKSLMCTALKGKRPTSYIDRF